MSDKSRTREEIGVVKEIRDGMAAVYFRRGAACIGCNHCSNSGDGASMVAKVPVSHGAKEGDTVKIESTKISEAGGGFLVFILPLIFFVAAFLLGTNYIAPVFGTPVEGTGIISGFIGLLIPWVAIYLARKISESRGKYAMVISEVIRSPEM